MPGKRARLAARRKAVGFTQDQLAEQLKVDRSTIARWEGGETGPQPWVRPRLARTLKVSIDELDVLLHEVGSAGSVAAFTVVSTGSSGPSEPVASLLDILSRYFIKSFPGGFPISYTHYVDPELAALVPMLPRINLGDVEASRALLLQASASAASAPPDDGVAVASRLIPGLPDSPEVKVRLYQPAGEAVRPALVYFHGGAFVLGQVELFDHACKKFATGIDALVVSVDYRLAPEHPFPAAVDDCYAALEWVASNAKELGVDPAAIAVGGLSAGGALAAAVSLLARDRSGPVVAFQLLINPVLDDRLDTPSIRACTDTPLWNSHDATAMWHLYLGPEHGQVSPYAAPARATDLAGLPPAYVLTSEFDPLRDEGIAYALRLLQAGVSVELHNYAGTFHGFDAFSWTAISQAAMAEQHSALRRALRRPA